MRKQYFFRRSDGGLLAWDVDRLIQLSRALPRKTIPLGAIREIDQHWSGDDEPRTWRAMIEHMRLVEDADLSYPIILSADGTVMDGMHRVAKAALQSLGSIDPVQFTADPEPDHLNRAPGGLPY